MVAAVWYDYVSGSLTNTLAATTAGATQTMTSEGLKTLGIVTTGVTQAKVTLDPFGVNGTPELVYVTTHAAGSNTATITRVAGQPLRQHLASTTWLHGPTAEDFREFQAQLNTFTYQCQAAVVTGGPTAGGTELTIGSLSIPGQVSAYQLDCAAFWSGLQTVSTDAFWFRVKVAGVVKATVMSSGSGRTPFSIPTTSLVSVPASTVTAVVATIQRASGSGSISEAFAGQLTARMSFFL